MRALPVLMLALAACIARGGNDEPLRWWKGNLHTHSLWSDGDEFPEVIAQWYRDRRYHFLAMSDHNVSGQGERWMDVTSVAARAKGEPWRSESHRPTDAYGRYLKQFGSNWVETRSNPTNSSLLQVRIKPLNEYRVRVESWGRFLMLPAEEITHAARNQKTIHMGAVNLLDSIAPQDGGTVPDVMSRVLQAVRESAARHGTPALVHVNHPNYKWGVTAEDLASVLDEHFFEVWNGVDGDNDPGDAFHPSTDVLWDIANTLRLVGLHAPPLYALATDDSHDYQGNKMRSPPGRAWVMVRARQLTPESLIRAMEAGDFYATTGVLLNDVRFDRSTRKYSLRIEPKGGERFVTRFIGSRRGANLIGQPRLDGSGKPMEATLDYSPGAGHPIGEVFAEVEGVHPGYTFHGDELYVRAVVVSTAKPDVPSTEFPFKRAWTQPVGWAIPSKAP